MSTWNNLISLLGGMGQAQSTAAGGPTPQPIVPTAAPEANAPTFGSRFAQLEPDVVHPLQALANMYHMAYQHPGRALQAATPLGAIFDVTANPWHAFAIGPATNPLLHDITASNPGATAGDMTAGLLNALKAHFSANPEMLTYGFFPEVLDTTIGDLPGEFPSMPEMPKGYPTEPYQPSFNPYGGPNPEMQPGWEPDISKIKIPGYTQEQILTLRDRLESSLGTKLEASRHINRIKDNPVRVKSLMQHFDIIPITGWRPPSGLR